MAWIDPQKSLPSGEWLLQPNGWWLNERVGMLMPPETFPLPVEGQISWTLSGFALSATDDDGILNAEYISD